ncbi:MAG: DUF2298 domain-containing protein [Patescibacteria group bacterium]
MFQSTLANDLVTIAYAYLLTGVFQIVVMPWLLVWGRKHLVDGGWAWGRSIGWLVVGLIIWFLAHLKLPVNSQMGLWSLLGVLLGLSILKLKASWPTLLAFLKEKAPLILVEELLFVFGFFFLSIVRGYNPQILDLEKFMDAGFMVSYSKSPTLPALDMWFAGETMNYYTFGHFLGGILLNFWGIGIDRAYNLALGLVMGLVMMQSGGLVANLTAYTMAKNKTKHLLTIPIVAGIVAALLVGFAGNSHTFWYFFKNLSQENPMDGYWYPDATRFIYHTIHEFPAYSFVVSDLHAHVWSLVFVLLIIPTIWLWLKVMIDEKGQQVALTKRGSLYLSGIIGILLGVLLMTSAWDMAIFGLLLVVVSVCLLLLDRSFFLSLLLAALVVLVSIVVTSCFWWLNFKSISEGLGFVEEGSTLRELAILWGWHVIGSLLASVFAVSELLAARKKRISHTFLFILSMTIAALVLLLLPELIFVKDIYTDHPRANTMFKLTFQAFTLMSLVVAWFFGFIQQRNKFDIAMRTVLISIMMVLFVSIFSFVKYSYKGYYNFQNYQGLDGLKWLQEKYPADYKAIVWLRENIVGQPVVLEAVGDSYTDYERVSVFTGLPTIVGWRVHEWLWRGGYDEVGERAEQVRVVYEEPESLLSQEIIAKYWVQYIFIGEKERQAYADLDEQKLLQLGNVVFSEGQTIIIKLGHN